MVKQFLYVPSPCPQFLVLCLCTCYLVGYFMFFVVHFYFLYLVVMCFLVSFYSSIARGCLASYFLTWCHPWGMEERNSNLLRCRSNNLSNRVPSISLDNMRIPVNGLDQRAEPYTCLIISTVPVRTMMFFYTEKYKHLLQRDDCTLLLLFIIIWTVTYL